MPALDTAPKISLKSIVVATDFSPVSKLALRYAAGIARHYKSKICLVHAIEPKSYVFAEPMTMEQTIDQLITLAQERIHDEAQKLFGIEFQECVEQGTAVEVVQRMVIISDVDLVVVGTCGTEGLGKLLVGSTAEGIFRQVQCPVLTVGPNVRDQDSIPELSQILLPADLLSDESRAVDYAVSLAREYKAHLALLHVVEDVEPPIEEDAEAFEELYRQRLERLIANGADLSYPPEYLAGFEKDAVKTILKVAKERATDLIVLGVRRAEPWTSHLKDKAYRIVAESPCPVLTVPESVRRTDF